MTVNNVDSLDIKIKHSKKAVDHFLNGLVNLDINPSDILLAIDGDRHAIYANMPIQTENYVNTMNAYIAQKSESMGIHLLDLHPIFENDYKENEKSFSFKTDYHWNSYGHRLVANSILNSNFLTP